MSAAAGVGHTTGIAGRRSATTGVLSVVALSLASCSSGTAGPDDTRPVVGGTDDPNATAPASSATTIPLPDLGPAVGWDDPSGATVLFTWLEVLSRCDCVLTLPGWKTSEGAKAEVELAKEIGLPIFNFASQIGTWIGKEADEDLGL